MNEGVITALIVQFAAILIAIIGMRKDLMLKQIDYQDKAAKHVDAHLAEEAERTRAQLMNENRVLETKYAQALFRIETNERRILNLLEQIRDLRGELEARTLERRQSSVPVAVDRRKPRTEV
jgi:hypothetical protein